MKNNNNFNKNVNSVDTNENNKLNGDDFMKNIELNDIKKINKKAFKGLGKSKEYKLYCEVVDNHNELNRRIKKLDERIEKYLEDVDKYEEELEKTIQKRELLAEKIEELATKIEELENQIEELSKENTELAKENTELAKDNRELAKQNIKLAKEKEELKAENNNITSEQEVIKAHQKINADKMNKLNEYIEYTKERKETAKDEFGAKAFIVNSKGATIKAHERQIARAKKEIQKGIDVGKNKRIIELLEAQINMEEEQKKDAAITEAHERNNWKNLSNTQIKLESKLRKHEAFARLQQELFGDELNE